MTVEALMQTPCTLLARTQDGPADEYGNPTWQEAEQETRCGIEQAGASEELGDAVQVTRWRVYLPADAPAEGWDVIRLANGTTLQLAGNAWPVRNFRTDEISHVEAEAVEVA